MPIYQNTSVTDSKLLIGNCAAYTSVYASAAGSFTWVNMGAGMVTNATHAPEFYDAQAGNAPDPIEGVSRELVNIELELIEFDASVMAVVSAGLVTAASTGTVMTMYAGGNTQQTPRAYKLVNTRLISGATKETIITVFKGTMTNGPTFNFKSDNDTDPVGTMPMTILAKLDTSKTVGQQLYSITRTILE